MFPSIVLAAWPAQFKFMKRHVLATSSKQLNVYCLFDRLKIKNISQLRFELHFAVIIRNVFPEFYWDCGVFLSAILTINAVFVRGLFELLLIRRSRRALSKLSLKSHFAACAWTCNIYFWTFSSGWRIRECDISSTASVEKKWRNKLTGIILLHAHGVQLDLY